MLNLLKSLQEKIEKADELHRSKIETILQKTIGHLASQEIEQRCKRIVLSNGNTIYTLDDSVFLQEEIIVDKGGIHFKYTLHDFVSQDNFLKTKRKNRYWTDSGKYLND